MMVVWDSRAGEKLLDLGNVLRCSGADWLMDRMGGSEGKGRNHGWLLTAGSITHVDGDPLPEMGEEQVWSVVAAPGLKTPGTKPASAFPWGPLGEGMEKVGQRRGDTAVDGAEAKGTK